MNGGHSEGSGKVEKRLLKRTCHGAKRADSRLGRAQSASLETERVPHTEEGSRQGPLGSSLRPHHRSRLPS